jgi:hypothetical protein
MVGRSEDECQKRYQTLMHTTMTRSLPVNTSLQVSNPLVSTDDIHPGMTDLKPDELGGDVKAGHGQQGMNSNGLSAHGLSEMSSSFEPYVISHPQLRRTSSSPVTDSGYFCRSSMTSGLSADTGNADMVQRKSRPWGRDEDVLLKQLVEQGLKWHQITAHFTDRSESECRARWSTFMNQDSNKGEWTSEEDQQLAQLVDQLGHVGPSRWSVIAKRLGTNRSKLSVRQRYEALVRSGVIEDRLGLDKISQEDIGGDDFEVEEVADDDEDASSKLMGHHQTSTAQQHLQHNQFFYTPAGAQVGTGFDPTFPMHQAAGMAAYQNYYPSYAPMIQFQQPGQYSQYQTFQQVAAHPTAAAAALPRQQPQQQQVYGQHLQFGAPQLHHAHLHAQQQMRQLQNAQQLRLQQQQAVQDDDFGAGGDANSKRPKRTRKPPKRDYDSMILSGPNGEAAPRETSTAKRTRRASTGETSHGHSHGHAAGLAGVANTSADAISVAPVITTPPTKKSSLAAAAAAAAADTETTEGKRRWNPWTPDEDALLVKLVQQHMSWKEIADHLPGRTKSDCQSRWSRHVNPEINKGPWTKAEDEKLIRLHKQLRGNVPEIAKQLGTNRTYLDTKRRLEKLNRGTAK